MEPDIARIGRDPEAFEAFYRAHVGAVTGFCARRIGSAEEVADLVAEVFIAVIEHAESYRPERGSARGWLYGIARRRIADHDRRREREGRALERLQGRRLLTPDSLARLEERVDAESDARRAYPAVSRLPDLDRALLELVSLDGLTIADAAQVLGVKPVTARVRLHRARARVRQLLEVSRC